MVSDAHQVAERQLTARSVLASTLLGTEPPRLPVAFLVKTGSLFGLSESAVRTALSRMVSTGEASADGDGWYSLEGALAGRQTRQRRSRDATTVEWNGRWHVAVIEPGTRDPNERAGLRQAMARLRMAEFRDGVWLRPDNLDRRDAIDDRSIVDRQCLWLNAVPELTFEEPEDRLVGRLWDLEAWQSRATELRRRMHALTGELERGRRDSLAGGFVLSAAVLRHFGSDPLLPRELLPRSWSGDSLRRDYGAYDKLYRERLAAWTESGGAPKQRGPQLRS